MGEVRSKFKAKDRIQTFFDLNDILIRISQLSDLSPILDSAWITERAMAPPRKSTGLVRGKANRPEESDNDVSSQDEEQVHKLPKGVKAEILTEYRYQPIDFRTGETKLKQLLAELKITTTGLDDCLNSLTDAATDVAEVLPSFRDEFDENDMPKDHVSRVIHQSTNS